MTRDSGHAFVPRHDDGGSARAEARGSGQARRAAGVSARRAVILPVVLFILILVGLLSAMFSFRVNADLASLQALAFRVQTRLAAEAGIERAKILLATDRSNMDLWYHNPDELHRVIVWASGGDRELWGTNAEALDEGTSVYRFSLVADDPTDDEDYIRFGITDESSKLNLNLATEAQLRILVEQAVAGDESINAQDIVDAILDWRDVDSTVRSEVGDTEGEYYRTLDKPYRIKNGPFDTVEELLLVKGVTNAVLYGEDFDRNGLLTANEDDGDDSFPTDDQNNRLNRGLYPYLTVVSIESNVSNDNRPRIYLAGDENVVREQLLEVFEDEPEVVDYIVTVTRAQGRRSGAPAQGDQAAPNDGTTPSGATSPESATPAGSPGNGSTGSPRRGDDPKAGTRQQVKEPPAEGGTGGQGEPAGTTPDGTETDSGDAQPREEGAASEGETGDARDPAGPMLTPVSLLLPRSIGGELRTGPVGVEHLARLWDRTTLLSPDRREVPGLININTAPYPVLRCIEELTEEQIGRIISVRGALDGEEKATPAWLAIEEVVDLETLERIAPRITARGQQFSIVALGYADHIGMVTRLHVVVDMTGPIAQTIYYRDESYLGARFPIREEDLENLRGR